MRPGTLDRHHHVDRRAIAARATLRKRIRDELWVSEKFADLIVDEWEAEAMSRGLAPLDGPYWSDAARWIAERFMDRFVH
jgi:hypothetical protein